MNDAATRTIRRVPMKLPLLLFLVLRLTVAGGDEAATGYLIASKKAEDAITVRLEGEATVFLIRSVSGIGEATVTRQGEAWPAKLEFRLSYADNRPFHWLEGLGLTFGKVQVHGSFRETGQMPYYLVEGDQQAAARARPDGHLDIRAQRRDDGMHIVLPANLLRGSDSVTIRWIDAYR